MITAHVYICPERGDVDYFLTKLVPKGQIADCIRIREATADTTMMKIKWFVIFLSFYVLSHFFCKIIKFKILNKKNIFSLINYTGFITQLPKIFFWQTDFNLLFWNMVMCRKPVLNSPQHGQITRQNAFKEDSLDSAPEPDVSGQTDVDRWGEVWVPDKPT